MRNLTIIIPYRDERKALERCLESLPQGVNYIVVDDCSTVEPPVPSIRLSERRYFSGAVNVGISSCDTDVLVINQDIYFRGTEWLTRFEELRERYDVFGDGVFNHPAWPNGYVQGTLMYMSRKAINAVGLLNEKDFPLWGSTCEWQLRACRLGFKAFPFRCDWFVHARRLRYGASIDKALKDEPEKKSLFLRTPPLVSVVIPTYNHAEFLSDAIESLMVQTFQAFDVIVVDDASTDETSDVSDAWRGIKYIRLNENVGTAAALNVGVRASVAPYIQVLNADDMLEPTALEKLYRFLEPEEKAFAYPGIRTFGLSNEVWKLKPYDFDSLLDKNHVHAGIMLPRKAWEEVGGWPEEFRYGREDWAMAVALGEKGYCGKYLDEPLYLYRRHEKNRTLRNTDEDWRMFFAQQMRNRFPSLYRGERPMGCCGSGRRVRKEEKTVLLQYVGENVGRTVWYGKVTGTRYRIKGSRPLIYVYESDVPGMLEVFCDGKPVFRRVE